jgi:Lon protease-like protein
MARVSETAQQKEDWRLTLPVFFYNDLMCPGEILSLHLFEPRYKVTL